jgi:hypothetical protein
MTSGQATPGESDEDVAMDGQSQGRSGAPAGAGAGGRLRAGTGNGVKDEKYGITEADIMPKGEVFTCTFPLAYLTYFAYITYIAKGVYHTHSLGLGMSVLAICNKRNRLK